MSVYECIWVLRVYLIVFECTWVYVSVCVFECMWVLQVYLIVFECIWVLWKYLIVFDCHTQIHWITLKYTQIHSNTMIFNPFVSYHHFQTFTIGDLSVCKGPCSSRQTNSAQAKTTVNAFANPDSIRLSRVPEMQPDLHYRSLHRKPIVPTYLLSGQVRKSENDRYNDSSHIQLPRFL